MRSASKSSEHAMRFTFLAKSFAAPHMAQDRILLSFSIDLEEESLGALHTSWLSQANLCISEAVPDRNSLCRCGKRTQLCRYGTHIITGVLDKLWCAVRVDVECHRMLREDGTLQEAAHFRSTH